LFFFTGIEKQYFKKLEQVETSNMWQWHFTLTWVSITETNKNEVKFSFPIIESSVN
jgi:hypothetical protein